TEKSQMLCAGQFRAQLDTTTGTQPSGWRGVSFAPCCSVNAAFLLGEPRVLVVVSSCARQFLFSGIAMKKLVFILCPALFLLVEVNLLAGKGQEWHTEKGFKWAEMDVPQGGKTGFTSLPADQTGITFTNSLDEKAGAANRVLYNGSGVAV